MRIRRIAFLTVVLIAASSRLFAQESLLASEFRREAEDLAANCNEVDAKKLMSCVTTVFTDHPVHVAVGSIAPQNGFAFGPAFVLSLNPTENWRLGWTADAVRAFGGAWRAGAYMKAVRTAVEAPRVVLNPGASSSNAPGAIHAYPVFNAYIQAISLPTLTFYGVGPESARDAKSFYGFGETIVGANGIVPIARTGALNLSLLGEINGRFVDLRAGRADDGVSIEQRFAEPSAPGVSTQPGFFQLGEGVRIGPSLIDGRLRLNYRAQLQQFIASDSTYSFRRWTLDLNHDVPIYRDSSIPAARDTNLPNECAIDPSTARCPAISRNRTGVVSLRALLSKAAASDDSVVPFYFQPTLGGSTIDGARMLPSYDDYRFRGPKIFWMQESVEHSIYGPVGLWVAADQGKVASQDGRFGDLRHSYTIGLTVRAGGLPVAVASWSTGGAEGSHFSFTISTSLLGGSPRPALQ